MSRTTHPHRTCEVPPAQTCSPQVDHPDDPAAGARAGSCGEVVQPRLGDPQRRDTMGSRAAVEEAKGMPMRRYGLTTPRAFAVLARWSRVSNVEVRTLGRTPGQRLTEHHTIPANTFATTQTNRRVRSRTRTAAPTAPPRRSPIGGPTAAPAEFPAELSAGPRTVFGCTRHLMATISDPRPTRPPHRTGTPPPLHGAGAVRSQLAYGGNTPAARLRNTPTRKPTHRLDHLPQRSAATTRGHR